MGPAAAGGRRAVGDCGSDVSDVALPPGLLPPQQALFMRTVVIFFNSELALKFTDDPIQFGVVSVGHRIRIVLRIPTWPRPRPLAAPGWNLGCLAAC